MNHSTIQRILCIICSRFAAADVSAAVDFHAFAGILTVAGVSALPAVAGVPVSWGVSASDISTVAGVSDNNRTLSVPAIAGTLFVAGVSADASVTDVASIPVVADGPAESRAFAVRAIVAVPASAGILAIWTLGPLSLYVHNFLMVYIGLPTIEYRI